MNSAVARPVGETVFAKPAPGDWKQFSTQLKSKAIYIHWLITYNKANIYGTKCREQEQRETTDLAYEVIRAIYGHYLSQVDECTG